MGFMSPSTPKPPPAPKVPTKEESAAELAAASEKEKQRLKNQRGRAATRLSGTTILGDAELPKGTQTMGSGLATKTLMGG